MRIYSSSFFHYTESKDSLMGILEKGFKVYFCKEELSSETGTEIIGIPMVSFCDIPLSCIDQINYGGQICVGMKRTWGIARELQPVFYYSNNKQSHSSQIISDAVKEFFLQKSENSPNNKNLYNILGFSKPITKYSNIKGLSSNNYIEREWRKVYLDFGIQKWKSFDEYQVYRGDKNSQKKHVGSPLKFSVEDIDLIVVPQKFIAEVINKIFEESFSMIGGKELVKIDKSEKISLISKIISFESLKYNM